MVSSTRRGRQTRGATAQSDGPTLDPRTRLLTIGRLFSLLRPHRGRFAAATVTLLLGSALSLAYPQAARLAVDAATEGATLERVNLIAAILAAAFLAQAALLWVRHYLMSWLGERVVADLRARVYARLLSLPMSWFQQRQSGEITGRLASDVAAVQSVVGSELSMALREATTLVGGLALLFWQHPRLTLWMLAIIPPLLVVAFAFGRRIRKLTEGVQDRLAQTSAEAQESIAGIATVQAFMRESENARSYGARVEGFFVSALGLARWRGLFISTMTLAGSLAMTAILWLGAREVIKGTLTAGELTAFLLYTSMVAFALGGLAALWGSLEAAAGASKRLFDILDTVPDIRDPEDPAALPPRGRRTGSVAFEDVTFAYPAATAPATGAAAAAVTAAGLDGEPPPRKNALTEVSFRADPGELVALVGRSGAGKSTAAALIFRFFDVDAGRVVVNGVDVKRARLGDLRSRLAIVQQEPVLFTGSIAMNIAYGRPGAGAAEIEAAARAAHAHGFIMALPDGYDSEVGERGVKLSGGQRQRIAIARAFLADPEILILDEATSSLDGESEAKVQDALTALMQGRTTIVIAHRLSTVIHATRIVVIDDGRVVQAGSHEALLAAGGVYRTLVTHQLVGRDSVAPPAAAQA